MPILKELPLSTMKMFVAYLMIIAKTDILKIDDVHILLSYFIKFLKNNEIYIIVSHNGSVVYKHLETDIIIHCDMKPITDVMEEYKQCIIVSFNYLDKPF